MLSLGYENIPNISEFTLQKIWKEAHELVTFPGYVQPVAGCNCPFARQVYNTKQPARLLVLIIQPVRKNYVGLHFACESARARHQQHQHQNLQQQSQRLNNLAPVLNKLRFSTPPEGEFQSYLLKFRPAQVSKC